MDRFTHGNGITQVTNGPASPEATGLEVDKMSKKWIAEHFDRFIGEILKDTRWTENLQSSCTG